MAFSPQANYTDWATATCRRNLVPTCVDRGVSRGQRGRSPTVVNLSFPNRFGCLFAVTDLIPCCSYHFVSFENYSSELINAQIR
jgi:hypothetical protein